MNRYRVFHTLSPVVNVYKNVQKCFTSFLCDFLLYSINCTIVQTIYVKSWTKVCRLPFTSVVFLRPSDLGTYHRNFYKITLKSLRKIYIQNKNSSTTQRVNT